MIAGMRRGSIAVIVWLAAALLPASELPTPANTEAEFRSHCQRLREGDNAFFGRQQITQLERLLQAEPADEKDNLRIRTRLALEHARLGELDEAFHIIREARESANLMTVGAELYAQVLSSLAIIRMQLGERDNCHAAHQATSCILPLAPEAVHRAPGHNRAALQTWLDYLQIRPDDPVAWWLLNLTAMTVGGYPQEVPPALRLPPGTIEGSSPGLRWRNLAPRLGVAAFDLGGGALMEDFDGDGDLDLVSSSWDPCEPLKAYRNLGNGTFDESTADWGLSGQLGGLNLVHADYDNDGMADILVLRGAWLGSEGKIRNSLLRNDLRGESGVFQDVTAAAGLAYPAYPTQAAAWADYDNDGDLDLFVGNESPSSSSDPLLLIGGTRDPYPSQLFRNEGDGRFTDVARSAGVRNLRFTKSAAWGDYDNDGDPDLYVSNVGENRLYRNNGNGTFTDVAVLLGVTEPSRLSFASWFFDYDNDGDLDLFVADYSVPVETVAASYFGVATPSGQPLLYRNDGGRFTEVSRDSGLDRPILPMGANFGDFDSDGWLDIYLGTGVPDFEAIMPNVMYRGSSAGFRDFTFDGGFGHLQKGHGIAFGDLNFDGRPEIFQQMGGAYPFDAFANALYVNPDPRGAWLVLRLVGQVANRTALGARVAVTVETPRGPRTLHRVVGTGGSFGGSSLQLEVGLGEAIAIRSVHVTWPGSGTEQVFETLQIDSYYRITEGSETAERLPVVAFSWPGEGHMARDPQGFEAEYTP